MVRIASATGVPWATSTSTWRSLATISSGLCLFLDMDPSSFGSEAILQAGPLQRGRIRHRRGASAGAARLSGELQHDLAHRTAWVPDTRSRAAEPAFTRGTSRVGSNPVSHKPRAVQDIRAHLSTPKLSTLGRVKAYWKVSIKSLIRRSHQLKLITDLQYKKL